MEGFVDDLLVLSVTLSIFGGDETILFLFVFLSSMCFRLSSLFFFSFLVVTISWGVKTDFSTLHFTITKKMSFVAGTYAQARGTLLCHRVAHINTVSKQKVVSSSLSINVRAGVRGRRRQQQQQQQQHVRVSASSSDYPQSTEELYFILGVSVGASQEAVKRAYKRKAKRYHPDVNDSPESVEQFLQIKAAYETLQSARGNLENVQTREWKEKWKQQLGNLRKEREKKMAANADRSKNSESMESLVGTAEMQAQISNQLRNLRARTDRKRTRQQTLQKSTFKEPFELSEEDLWNHEVQ